jgi:methylmalonyl-CoA mutase cobalamin-binding domain/chain
MQNRGISDIPVIVGGIVPEKDEKLIKKLGVKKVFHPYDKVDSITNQIKEIANEYLAIKMMQE